MTDFFKKGEIVSVQVTQPIGTALSYKAPSEGCYLGSYVQVTLGQKEVIGVVWGLSTINLEVDKIKVILKTLNIIPMTNELMNFLEKVSLYTITPLSFVLRLATRVPNLGSAEVMNKKYSFSSDEIKKPTTSRSKVLNFLKENHNLNFELSEIMKKCGVSSSVIHGLVSLEAISVDYIPKDQKFLSLNPFVKGKLLTDEQALAVKKIRGAGTCNTILLNGVTGSGKTEVYLECIADCIKENKQALVLLPEIGLTAEFLARVEARFGARPGEWHSGINVTERRRVWKMVSQGKLQLVVGARSALFLPFQTLGLIVVDEEHDHSYKQDDGVLYNARDMAVFRGSLSTARVVLASATPSLESWVNARKGKYFGVNLEWRYGGATLPSINAIDMRSESLSSGKWISPTLLDKIKEKLEKGEQTLLFLNRRGYAPVTICRSCGEQISCDQCDSRMVQHRFVERLICHQCGKTSKIPNKCNSCNSDNTLSVVGPGIERLAEEVTKLFPTARIGVLSSDLFSTPASLRKQLSEIENGNIDIIVGTQLVAKGHNFPKLTLVGVIDADLGLQGADLRAAERTFQLINQVSGRAGRQNKAGETLIQTYDPEHRVIRALLEADLEKFWSLEASDREKAGAPPFGRFAGIILSGANLKNVEDIGKILFHNSTNLRNSGVQIFGPAPAPFSRIKGKYRQRMLVKAEKDFPIQRFLKNWVLTLKSQKGVRIQIDIDPYNFL